VREPEFLPEWYVRQVTSSRRRRVAIRAAAVVLAIAGLWLVAWSRRAAWGASETSAAAGLAGTGATSIESVR
jgi:hypothetical protein